MVHSITLKIVHFSLQNITTLKAKHTLDELVTKRIKITPYDAAQLVFHLEEITQFYNKLKAENPKILKAPERFHSRLEIDFADFGSMHLWARTMVDRCDTIQKKAEKGTIIIGESKNHPHFHYSDEEGLVQINECGKMRIEAIDVLL